MAQVDIDAKKELARIKMAERNRLPHRKEDKRKREIAKGKERKAESTARRCSEHTMEELLTIMRKKCAAANLNFDEYQDRIRLVLHILHGDTHVFNADGRDTISVPSTPSPENTNAPSQKNNDVASPSIGRCSCPEV